MIGRPEKKSPILFLETPRALLVVASFFMLKPIKERKRLIKKGVGYWYRRFGGNEYSVPLLIALPVTLVTGFVAGMIGVSGGSFKIPLMVLACGVPMSIAVGTSSAMVALTAISGFMGHTLRGDFNPEWALPAAAIAIAGGLIGGRISVKTDPEKLKLVFALTTLAAAAFMIINALLVK